MSTDQYNEHELNMLAQIDKHGWFGMHVFDPEGKNPEFSYSIGFSKTLSAPEIIIFGLSKDLRHSMMWEMFRQIKGGATLENDKSWSDLLEGFDCISMEAIHVELLLSMPRLLIGFGKSRVRRVIRASFSLFGPALSMGYSLGKMDVLRM